MNLMKPLAGLSGIAATILATSVSYASEIEEIIGNYTLN